MRRVVTVILALAMMMLGSCSSSEPLALDLANPMGSPPAAFSITGPAADEGVVCSEGTFVGYRMEDMDGNAIDHGDWSATFDTAIETNSVAEVKSINEYQCGDGSGTITVTQLVRFDFAELDIETFGEGEVTNGTWTLVGIGDYESLTGSGDIITNFDDGHVHMVGEVEA
jgi:hypothetical protein